MDKTNTAEDFDAAAVLGAAAFARGIGRAPALDPEFVTLAGGDPYVALQIGDPRGIARLRGWMRGWDAARLVVSS